MDDELEEIRERKLESLQNHGDRDRADEETTAAVDAPAEPVHVEGGDHLRELVDSSDVVLVDFYADWCGPCKMLEPVVETIAAETAATVAKVDVDEHQPLAGEFQVRGVPTVVLFADGEVRERFSGVRGEGELRQLVEQYA